VWFFDTLLTQLEVRLGLEKRIALEALIEETEALTCVEAIAACSPRLEALILGVGDLAASQGVRIRRLVNPEERYPGDLWHYARNRMVVAARAHGLDAIDGPYFNYADRDGFHREASWSATLGCVGKWCSRRPTRRSASRGRCAPRMTAAHRAAPALPGRAASWSTPPRCGSSTQCWNGRGSPDVSDRPVSVVVRIPVPSGGA